MAGPLNEVVLASVVPEVTATFLSTFDLQEVDRVALDPSSAETLIGRASPGGTALRLASPLSRDVGSVLVVPAADPASAAVEWSVGPRALDLYSADLDASIEAARAAGYQPSPEAVLEGGAMRMRQALFQGPEGLPVVLVDSTHRRSSVCDLPEAPLHSEVHSVVWCVVDHQAEVSRWETAGWTAAPSISFSEPTVSDELGLPERPTPITMTMLSDAEVNPTRVELLTFDDHAEESQPARLGAKRSLGSLTEQVDDLASAVTLWGDGASVQPATECNGHRAQVVTTLGGVRLVLIEGS